MPTRARAELPDDVRHALDDAAELEARGALLEAIDLLDTADRGRRHAEIERTLVRLRAAAFPALRAASRPSPWADLEPFEAPLYDALPVVEVDELTPSRLRSGLHRHGCVLLRGLVPRARCSALVADIDRAFETLLAAEGQPRRPDPEGWYEPFDGAHATKDGPPLGIQRHRAAKAGSLWTVDSPRLLQDVCTLTDEVGLRRVIEAYLGERPAMSATKSNLRRVPTDAYYADWHQDGAFLGEGIRTINVWITLTDCGVDAPTMDIVPTRIDHIVETGTEGAIFDWAASPAKVAEAAEAAGGVAIVRPRFDAGDVLLFDEMFLHRTACTEEMTRRRYALEHWYFAPSGYPDAQIPLVY